MDWKTLLGSAYTEGMTDEDAQAKFNEIYMPRSDHEKEIARSKSLIDQYSAQIAENKRKERERMSEDEKKAAEEQERWANLENQNKALQRELNISKLAAAYVDRGFDKDFATETATAMYDGDNATVLSNEKIFADKREAALKSKWEKEYSVNPPAGNGAGKIDFSKEIAAAQEAGNMVAMASYIRQQAEANRKK